MKIACITPWKVKCGIYTYSRALTKALAELDVESYIVRLPRFGIKTPEILNLVAESVPVDKVDLVHVQHEYGLYSGLEGGFYGMLRRIGKPIVTTMHAIGNFNIDRVVSETSERVIVHNEFCAKRFDGPSVIIAHGCTPAKCVPSEEAKMSFGFKPEWPIVGYVGFISEYKGLEVLIEAMKGVPKAGLLIGGGWHVETETTYITQLKQRSFQALPGRVQWLGYVPDEDLPRTYGAFDILCYCSRFATESGALLMALGHGKAVLASDIAPFREKEETGALATFEDAEDLRGKICLLLGNDELRAGLERGARSYAEENSWEKIAEKHVELYESITTV